ncbi:MAG: RDD family protein [Aliarcobacter sp.]|nr:RDD family protein [Aliarcobacter sp.]
MAKWRDVKNNRVQADKPIKTNIKSHKSDLASLPLRLKAFLLDTFLITTPILYVVIYIIMGSGEDFAQNRSLGWGIIFAVHATIILIFWLKNGQTPGLKAYEIKLVDASTKQRVSVVQVLVRYVTTLVCVVSIFLMFFPFFNKDKKTFQDLFSNTIIINDK